MAAAYVSCSSDLFILNGSPSLCFVVFRNPVQFIRVKGKLSLGPSANSGLFLFALCHSIRTRLARIVRQPSLGHFEIANGSLSVFRIPNGSDPGSLFLGILTCLFSPLELLLLRQEVLQGTFAAEDVPSWAGDWLSGVFEAETAESERQE